MTDLTNETASPGEGAKRDGPATRRRILDVAMAEFAEHGYSGARVDRVSRGAGVNIRMIYHYFGGKDGLYLEALEESYRVIRTMERSIDPDGADPVAAIREIVEVTFDFLSRDPYFVRLVMGENLMKGEKIRRSEEIPRLTLPLAGTLEKILRKGQEKKIFKTSIDTENLYISILSLCFIHVSNRYTLESMFQKPMSGDAFLEKRKKIAKDMVVGYLVSGEVAEPK